MTFDIEANALLETPLGQTLARLVGARKSKRLVMSLYTSGIEVLWSTTFIDDAFRWRDTPQGNKYWCKLADRYHVIIDKQEKLFPYGRRFK